MTADFLVTDALPVTVVTGFLGAGKTTLVNEWLAEVERGSLAVIVNELGAVGFDGQLLQERARLLVEISGGCVCCTTQAELVRALDELAGADARPQRILIETSGAASPAGVLRAIAAGARREAFSLDGVITVVDASRFGAVLEHDLALEQLGYADVVVLSRADACSPEGLSQARAAVAAQNAAAISVNAARGKVVEPALKSLSELLALRAPSAFSVRSKSSGSASHDYQSVVLSVDASLDGERFGDFMENEIGRVAGRIFRIKGIVAIDGLEARMIVQGVADEVEVDWGLPWGDDARSSRLVVVGFGLDADELTRGFAACQARLLADGLVR
ncbi:MAG TPA: GTP-binding protein [Polyangiaceae bacterium]|nr:GTP-binding protein [Polyangiaceae bacterium]